MRRSAADVQVFTAAAVLLGAPEWRLFGGRLHLMVPDLGKTFCHPIACTLVDLRLFALRSRSRELRAGVRSAIPITPI